MFIVHVFVHVKADSVADFKAATLANVQNSILEEGIARFDFIEQQDDATRFVLVEVYRNPDAAKKHKGTEHYRAWRDTVEPMMAESRSSLKFTNIAPDDLGWDSATA